MCIDSEVRLAGGDLENERQLKEGRVEMCYNGVWGAVCANNGWDEIAAHIVCSQLGYNKSSEFGLLKSQCAIYSITVYQKVYHSKSLDGEVLHCCSITLASSPGPSQLFNVARFSVQH